MPSASALGSQVGAANAGQQTPYTIGSAPPPRGTPGRASVEVDGHRVTGKQLAERTPRRYRPCRPARRN